MTSKTDIPSSSFSPPPFRKLTYDVFLSFRGEDTRKNFTDHLYTALKQRGIFTFRDDEELERGKSIAPEIFKAIEESRYVIVVLSRNYANSSWCLDEIAKILECMEESTVVLPVFYDVDPSDVRKQTGDHFEEAFSEHVKEHPDKVERWRRALSQVANLSGWHLRDGYESKVIGEIVEKIFTELNDRISTSEGLVGMDSHLKKMLSYLDIGRPDVRIIGISGMGGIGKTTIAHVVSQRVKTQFEGNSFLENIREVIEKQGPVHLQEQLLSNLLKSNVNVQDTEMGKDIIKHRLCTRKVLIVLDDVDQDEQLEALCDRKWFGPGSRIIVTSRDEHLLNRFDVDEVYKVNPLTDVEALKLFRMKAFKEGQGGKDFLELSKEFLKYADGVPLAIKVLAGSVKGRSLELWSSALDRLKQKPEKKIIDVLKVSFDGLQETEKNIFLDIACFFKGLDRDRVTRILQGCDGYCPNIDIEVLIEKSMVTIFGRKLWMHDLIQTMGREIVLQQYPKEPEKRSRLWVSKEIIHVLDRSKATSAIESILLQGPTKDNVVLSINDSFSNMDRLRLLNIWGVKFSGNIKYLSNELQYLEWLECPLDSFPSDFQPDNLVELHMPLSRIKQLWRGEKGWGMLRHIDMTGSEYLISTPDFTEDWSSPRHFGCNFYGAEISKWKWFMHIKQGNSAEIPLPPNLLDDANWLGIAISAFNRLCPEDPNMSLGGAISDSEDNVVTCGLEIDGGLVLRAAIPFTEFGATGFAKDVTWFSYVPRNGKWFKSWRQGKLARATISWSNQYFTVQSCALGLVYNKDVEHLVHTLTSCELP
ncbi:hypothetical protein M0R45_027688 [Rubus argutus]|uniref:TIR domain-containing protein n=1 Tax=Rubus argutus TaxID=59490 RepID=A0AAW1X3T0_RUBAR